MPLVSIPFERITINIVGPLIQSMSHHKFLLVLVDYPTRYPISLRNIKTETIIRELA